MEERSMDLRWRGKWHRGAVVALWLVVAGLCTAEGLAHGHGNGLVDLSERLDELDKGSVLKMRRVVEEAGLQRPFTAVRAEDEDAEDSGDDDDNDDDDETAGAEEDTDGDTDGDTDNDTDKDNAEETGGGKVFTVPLNGDMASGTFTTELSIGGDIYRVLLVGLANYLIVPTSECSDCAKLPKVYKYRDQGIPCSGESDDDGFSCKKPDTCDDKTCFFGKCNDGSCCYEDSCGWGTDKLTDSKSVQVSGRLLKDKVSVEGSAEADVLIHGIAAQNELVQNGTLLSGVADAILGLSMRTEVCSPSCVPSILDTMAKAGVVSKPNYAFCLEDLGGIMSFGGSDPKHYSGSMSYVPLEDGEIPLLAVKEMKVLNEKVPMDSALMTMIDFQSVYHLMKPQLFDKLRHAFQSQPEVCKIKFFCQEDGTEGVENTVFNKGSCAPASVFSNEVLDKLPDVELKLKGNKKLTLSSRQYLFKTFYSETLQYYYCLAWAPSEELHSVEDALDLILGGPALLGQYMEFDRENQRIGFAEAKDCSGGCQTLSTCEECANRTSCAFCGLRSECAVKMDLLFQLCPQAADEPSKCSAIEGGSDGSTDSWESSWGGSTTGAGSEGDTVEETASSTTAGMSPKTSFIVTCLVGAGIGIALVMLTTALKSRRQRNPFEPLREENDPEGSDDQAEPMYR